MKKIVGVLVVFMLVAGWALPLAQAEEDGVAGCSAVRVNPDLSLEDQQSVCNAAERSPGSSCAASGGGTCSSPKLNDTMPDADHCICILEEEVLA